MQKIVGNELLQQLTTEDGCAPHYTYEWQLECGYTPCSGVGHTNPDDCPYADPDSRMSGTPPQYFCIGSWARILVTAGCPDLRDPNGSNGGNMGTPNESIPGITIPSNGNNNSDATGYDSDNDDNDGERNETIGIDVNDPLEVLDPDCNTSKNLKKMFPNTSDTILQELADNINLQV